MNNIERIQAIIVTLLGAAQRGGLHPEIAEPMHDDLMKRIANQSDEAVDLIARRLVEVANHEE
jgi:chorismate mutase